MGVTFDRILEDFNGPFEKLTDFAKVPAGKIAAQAPAGYYFTHQANDSFIVVNRLLAAGEDVSWLQTGPLGPGTFYVAAKPTTRALIQKAATDLGVSFESAATAPTGTMSHLKKLRIGLFDTYGGGMRAAKSCWNSVRQRQIVAWSERYNLPSLPYTASCEVTRANASPPWVQMGCASP